MSAIEQDIAVSAVKQSPGRKRSMSKEKADEGTPARESSLGNEVLEIEVAGEKVREVLTVEFLALQVSRTGYCVYAPASAERAIRSSVALSDRSIHAVCLRIAGKSGSNRARYELLVSGRVTRIAASLLSRNAPLAARLAATPSSTLFAPASPFVHTCVWASRAHPCACADAPHGQLASCDSDVRSSAAQVRGDELHPALDRVLLLHAR